MRCKRHQKGSDEISEDNRVTDQTAEKAAKLSLHPTLTPLMWDGSITHIKPQYTQKEQEWAKTRGYTTQGDTLSVA